MDKQTMKKHTLKKLSLSTLNGGLRGDFTVVH
jgi:hypothetical protein